MLLYLNGPEVDLLLKQYSLVQVIEESHREDRHEEAEEEENRHLLTEAEVRLADLVVLHQDHRLCLLQDRLQLDIDDLRGWIHHLHIDEVVLLTRHEEGLPLLREHHRSLLPHLMGGLAMTAHRVVPCPLPHVDGLMYARGLLLLVAIVLLPGHDGGALQCVLHLLDDALHLGHIGVPLLVAHRTSDPIHLEGPPLVEGPLLERAHEHVPFHLNLSSIDCHLLVGPLHEVGLHNLSGQIQTVAEGHLLHETKVQTDTESGLVAQKRAILWPRRKMTMLQRSAGQWTASLLKSLGQGLQCGESNGNPTTIPCHIRALMERQKTGPRPSLKALGR